MTKRIRFASLVPVYLVILSLILIVAAAGNWTVTTMLKEAPVGNRKCVIIDPGHGGVDGGATSCTGILESELNLEISLRLDDLMHLLGIQTVMIRKTDISVHTQGESIGAKKVSDLKQRVNITNSTENAMLVSIHQNHFSDSRYSGAQVFYAGTSGSDRLAKDLQAALKTSLNPASKRQAKKADGVYLLQNIKCPGVLVECGFLSNPEEEAKLKERSYQLKLCCVMACVVSNYLYSGSVA